MQLPFCESGGSHAPARKSNVGTLPDKEMILASARLLLSLQNHSLMPRPCMYPHLLSPSCQCRPKRGGCLSSSRLCWAASQPLLRSWALLLHRTCTSSSGFAGFLNLVWMKESEEAILMDSLRQWPGDVQFKCSFTLAPCRFLAFLMC